MPITQPFETFPASPFIMRTPDYVDVRVLTAGVAVQHTIPTDARVVVFSADGDFYAAYGTNPTATVPTIDVTDGTASEMNPTARFLKGQAKISLISADAAIITLSFFR